MVMIKKSATWRQKAALVLAACVAISLAVIAAELWLRSFSRINYLDNSRGMFAAERFGSSYGNTPNFEGVSFGQKFTTDENGFRADPKQRFKLPASLPAILIIGDSVTFGAGVSEENTIAGILRARCGQRMSILNASAIGYDTFDYENVLNSIISQRKDVQKVFLFLCLNDVNNLSAAKIRMETSGQGTVEGKDDAPPGAVPSTIRMWGNSTLQSINDYLRSRSKLYLWLKNALRDTQMIYFKNDLMPYQLGAKSVEASLRPLVAIKQTLLKQGITLDVFVLPYAVQTRVEAPPEFLAPQQLINKFLDANEIRHHDLTGLFQKQKSPMSLFLYGDPMHLSERGSLLTADAICTDIMDCGRKE
jgi:hypothetical protein